MTTLSKRLKAMRKWRKWTLKTLAAETGLSVPYLSDLERGKSNPSLNAVDAIAIAYDLNLRALLEGVTPYDDHRGESAPIETPEQTALRRIGDIVSQVPASGYSAPFGSYRLARGITGWQEGDKPAEESIRGLRDGGD